MNIIKVKEKSLLNQRRQRLAVWYVPILVLGALSDLLELSGSFDIFYKFTNSILLLLTLLWSTCYIVKKNLLSGINPKISFLIIRSNIRT